ncbi:MAG: 4Fe-4S dicluster domain-containing protein [Candidatus Helarchaeota archaeon]
MNDRYEKLAEKLDSMPIGVKGKSETFPKSFMELLQLMYTPEEAKIISNLEFFLEPVRKIARRINKTPKETEKILNELADKGLIFRYKKKNKLKFALFNSANLFDYPFLRSESPDKMKRMAELAMDWFDHEFVDEAFGGKKTGIYRVLPVEEDVKTGTEILSYETVAGLVDAMKDLTIIPCVCRKRMELSGRKICDHPTDESCITFGSTGLFFQERGYGRAISKEEAQDILKKYQKDGLVLMTTNSQEKILVLCACCSCCCVGLRGVLEFDKPAAVMGANFQIELNVDACVGCGNCVTRCVFKANTIVNNKARIDLDRCLGCGLCTITCEGNARTLVRVNRNEIPKTFMELGMKIAEEKK